MTNLINQWNNVTFSPTTTNFSITPASGMHGDVFSVAGNVTPTSGASIPRGVVWLQGGYSYGNLVGDSTVDVFPLDVQGAYGGVTHLLPGGTYQVNAHYAGDETYAGSDSSPAVQVTIQPEPTTTTFSVLTIDSAGNLVPFTSGPYGTPVYFQAHVSGQSGYGVPTAYVNFWDTNGFGAGPVWLDSKGNALTPPMTQIAAGTHSITAGYYGDNSFNASFDLTPINFTISQIATTTTLASQQTPQSFLLIATIKASGTSSPATGLVTFRSGSTALGTAYLDSGSTSNGTPQASATFDATQIAAGQYNVTASYPGDGNYTASTSTAMSLDLVADFNVADRGIIAQTVTAGQTASYINDLGVTPFFGFTGTVAVSCTVPAQGTNCSVNPASYSLASGAGIGTVSVTTTARSAAAQGSTTARIPIGAATWTGPLAAVFMCAVMFFYAQKRRPRLAQSIALGVLLLSTVGIGFLGCGGGTSAGAGVSGGGGSGGGSSTTGTPAGTYTVTVTATSGTLTHTTTLTLIVR